MSDRSEAVPELSSLCNTERNKDNKQLQCNGCSDAMRRRESLLHANFEELENCARHKGCVGCKLFRRAILQAQVTTSRMDIVRSEAVARCPIWTIWDNRSSTPEWIEIRVELCQNVVVPAFVYCRWKRRAPLDDVLFQDRSIWTPNYEQFKEWIQVCHSKHGKSCGAMKFPAKKNPEWLIQIWNKSNEIRLIKGPEEPVCYVPLSYSWGNESAMEPERWKGILRNWTKTEKQFRDRSEQRFQISDLTKTLRHAILIVAELGIQYIWIDSVCLPDWPNEVEWNVAATKIPEIYGNGHFTLYAACAEHADDRLLGDGSKEGSKLHRKRIEWDYRPKNCQVRVKGITSPLWLYTADMTIDEVRAKAPVSQRGWVFQEERLSPRVLYWSSGRVYWSCCKSTEYEQRNHFVGKDEAHQQDPPSTNEPQQFLEQCYATTKAPLRQGWLEIVKSYVWRGFTAPEDRFDGIAGLALRYLRASEERHGEGKREEQYIAGLWRGYFAQGLSWRFRKAQDPEKCFRGGMPSWSWASVPLGSEIDFLTSLQPTEHFTLDRPVDQKTHESMKNEEMISEGAKLKTIKVSGRLKRFIAEDCEKIRPSYDEDGAVQGFPTRDFECEYFRNLQSGEIQVAKMQQRSASAQLDYWMLPEGTASDCCLKDGDERQLYGLEIGLNCMLLLQLQKAAKDYSLGRYVRVGISYQFPENFFTGSEIKRIALK